MTFTQFWRGFSGGLIPHREQVRYLAAVDAGAREALLHWGKKAAKSVTAAVRALHYLVAEDRDPDDRLIAIASYDEEQSKIIFNAAEQLVERHTWLREHVRVLKAEMVYEETCREPRTGGTFRKAHRLRALARDTRGLHGEPWSLVCRDELWSEPNHDMTEALIPSPARPWTEILYTTYSTLATMRKPGVPFHDLMVRVEAKDPTLFYSFIGGSGDSASWRICPWIGEAWVEQQRRIFAASPSRFRRVVLNEQVLGGEGDTLLTIDEIKAAIDKTLPPVPPPNVPHHYIGGLDLGISNDHAVLTIGHLDPRGRFVVDVCQAWKADGRQIQFTEILDVVVRRHRDYPMRVLNVDRWEAKLLTEMLQRAGVPARLVSVEQTRLNQIVTVLKSAFSRRAVRIAPTQIYLLEQLEALRVLETRTPRRDLLKFAPSGTGLDASQHDDAAVSLGLCLIDKSIVDRIGRVTMADISQCNQAVRGRIPNIAHCFLAGGPYVPANDPQCLRHCAAFVSTREAMRDYEERGGEPVGGYRDFVAAGLIHPCSFLIHEKFRAAMGTVI